MFMFGNCESDPIIEYALRLPVEATAADSMRQSAYLVLHNLASSRTHGTQQLIQGISVGTLHDSSWSATASYLASLS